MANPIQEALDRLSRRIRAVESSQSVWSWATVTGTSPLLVRLESDQESVGVPVGSLVASLALGDRVWTQTVSGQVVILGRAV